MTRRTKSDMILFAVHLIVYSIALATLVAVNMVVAPTRPWVLLILFGWCGMLICHARSVLGARARSYRMVASVADERIEYENARPAF